MHLTTRLAARLGLTLVAAALLTTLTGAPAAASPASAAPPAASPPSAAPPGRHPASIAGAGLKELDGHRARTKQQSMNWAGYVRTRGSFTKAGASWTVPTLSPDHDGFSSTWVGIDGATSGDGYLIQTGTEADVSGGRRTYHAWWEVITPEDAAPETVFRKLTVHPGDKMRATVYRRVSGKWVMRLANLTTRHTASHVTSFAGPRKTAEFIQEDTMVNGYISAAPNWHAVTFHGVRLNGANPKLRASEAIDLVDSQGTREASTGAPNRAGDRFTVTWLAAGTRTRAG